MSPGVEANLGQRFIVESKPGADGAIGTGDVVRAAPDGYTLLLGPTAVFAVTPHMFSNLGFDPLTALDPISLLADAPLLAVIGANVPAKSLKELADYVRAHPGKFNYGSPGSGSPAISPAPLFHRKLETPTTVERLTEINFSLDPGAASEAPPGNLAAWTLEACLGSPPLSVAAGSGAPAVPALPAGSLATLSLQLSLDDGPWFGGEPLIVGSGAQPGRPLT